MVQKIRVTKEDEGKRLDKFLVAHIDGLTRNRAKRLITQERIRVGGRGATPSVSLSEGEEVEIISLRASASPDGKEFSRDDPEIIEDDNLFLVVNKPAGLIVHRPHYIEENTLVYLLLQKYPELKNIGEFKDRPGIVHRLDKGVSGLMVVAKDQRFFYRLKEQFENRRVLKKYQCLVYGRPPCDRENIDLPLKRSPKTGRIIAAPKEEKSLSEGAKEANTEYRVLRYYNDYTLLDLTLHTGRTHQIRAHMKSKGIPIVGDDLYTTRKAKRLNKKKGVNRVFLVAYRLGFYDAGGEFREFEIDIPEELQEFLEKLE